MPEVNARPSGLPTFDPAATDPASLERVAYTGGEHAYQDLGDVVGSPDPTGDESDTSWLDIRARVSAHGTGFHLDQETGFHHFPAPTAPANSWEGLVGVRAADLGATGTRAIQWSMYRRPSGADPAAFMGSGEATPVAAGTADYLIPLQVLIGGDPLGAFNAGLLSIEVNVPQDSRLPPGTPQGTLGGTVRIFEVWLPLMYWEEPPPPAAVGRFPLRQHPRTDGLAASSARRVYPPPRGIIRSLRQGPGSYL